jgi:hypothetical protein
MASIVPAAICRGFKDAGGNSCKLAAKGVVHPAERGRTSCHGSSSLRCTHRAGSGLNRCVQNRITAGGSTRRRAHSPHAGASFCRWSREGWSHSHRLNVRVRNADRREVTYLSIDTRALPIRRPPGRRGTRPRGATNGLKMSSPCLRMKMRSLDRLTGCQAPPTPQLR